MIARLLSAQIGLPWPENEAVQTPSQLSTAALRTLHQQGLTHYRQRESASGPVPWLAVKQELAVRQLAACDFCFHHCGVDRRTGPAGYCQQSSTTRLTGSYLHWGEEAPIRPTWAVFFGGCTLHCRYCHNWRETFEPRAGEALELETLVHSLRAAAGQYRTLSLIGGTPEPHLHQIIALAQMLPAEIDVPLVFNGNASLSSDGLAWMEGLIDLWLPDFKHGNNRCAFELTRVKGYLETLHANLRAYVAQGSALLVRHLVVPGHLECCTLPVLNSLAEDYPQVAVNVMLHYRPMYQAEKIPGLDRCLSPAEKQQVQNWIQARGLRQVIT